MKKVKPIKYRTIFKSSGFDKNGNYHGVRLIEPSIKKEDKMKYAKSIPTKKELDDQRFKCAVDGCKHRFGYGHAGMYCSKHARRFGRRK